MHYKLSVIILEKVTGCLIQSVILAVSSILGWFVEKLDIYVVVEVDGKTR